MTLVVACVVDGKVLILGDTALTTYNKRPTNPIVEGCLKQYIVNENLAVAFAGSQPHFEAVCRQVLSSTSVLEIAAIASAAQQDGADFELLAVWAGDSTIHFIKNGVITESAAGFLGDWQAFNAYQEYKFNDAGLSTDGPAEAAVLEIIRLPEPVTQVTDENYTSMYSALKAVIKDPAFPGVGGVIVPLCTDKGSFTFMNYADVVTGLLRLEDLTATPKPIEFGTAEQGGYAIEFGDNSQFGGDKKNVGFYILQGGFGIVFPDSETGLRRAQLVNAAQPAYWVLNTAKLLGHAIGSGYLTEHHCGIAGEELISQDRFDDAVFCYELRKDLTNLRDRPKLCDRYVVGYATAMFNAGKQNDAISMLRTEVNAHPDSFGCIDLLKQMIAVTQQSAKSAVGES